VPEESGLVIAIVAKMSGSTVKFEHTMLPART